MSNTEAQKLDNVAENTTTTTTITKTINQTKTVTKSFDSVKNEVTTTTVITTETTNVKEYENKQPQTTTVVTTKTTVVTCPGKIKKQSNTDDLNGTALLTSTSNPTENSVAQPTSLHKSICIAEKNSICETANEAIPFPICQTPINNQKTILPTMDIVGELCAPLVPLVFNPHNNKKQKRETPLNEKNQTCLPYR